MSVSKIGWALVILLVLITAIYFALNKPVTAFSPADENKVFNFSSPLIKGSQSRNFSSTNPERPKIVKKQYETLMGNAAEAEEVKNWYASRGLYFLTDSNREYLSYSQETLEKLSDAGDMRAMHALGDMYIDKDHLEKYGFDAAKNQYWKAALYGSTEAIIKLAFMKQTIDYDLLVNVDEKKSAALETLALYKLAELRGDRWSTENPVAAFKDTRRLQLSPSDEAEIDKRAERLYSDLQKKRSEMGLGEFDNSIPESVQKFFNKIGR